MALTSLGTELYFPRVHGSRGGTNYALDAANEKYAFVFTSPKSGTIDAVHININSITVSQSLKVSLQSVDANGDPSGTILGATNNGFGTLATPSTGFNRAALGESVTVSEATAIAVVVEFTATTGNISIVALNNQVGMVDNDYQDVYVTSWSKSAKAEWVGALEYSGATYPLFPSVAAYTTQGLETFNSGSSPAERGNLLVVPVDCTAVGIWMFGDTDGDVTASLYVGASHTASRTATAYAAQEASDSYYTKRLMFTSAVDLTAGTYRVTASPTGAGNMIMGRWIYNSTAMMGHAPMGTGCYKTSWTGAAWDDTETTNRMAIGLIVSRVHDGAGGGIYKSENILL